MRLSVICRVVCAFLMLVLTPPAQAQQWPTDLPPPLARNGAPTIFESTGVVPVIAQGKVKLGDVIAAFPVQYARVGRLKNDVYRFPHFGAPKLALPAGTAVFRAQLVFETGSIDNRALGPAHWCGVPAGASRALCWEEGKTSSRPDQVYLGNPYSNFPPFFPVGRGLVDGLNATFPIIQLDDSARIDLPPMEFVYVLTQPNYCSTFVQAGIRIEGRIQIFSSLDYGCGQQGKKGDRTRYMVFTAGDGVVCAYGVGNDGADILVQRQPTKYIHPWEHDVLADYNANYFKVPAADRGPDCPPKAN